MVPFEPPFNDVEVPVLRFSEALSTEIAIPRPLKLIEKGCLPRDRYIIHAMPITTNETHSETTTRKVSVIGLKDCPYY